MLGKRGIRLAETPAEVPSALAYRFGGSQARAQVVAWKRLPNGTVVGEAISLQLVSDVGQHGVIVDIIEQDLRRATGVESRHGTQAGNGASGRSGSEAGAARAPGARGARAQARARPRVTAQLQAPAIGYRAFKWDGTGPLKSTGVEASWPITREPQRAKCVATTVAAHNAPQEDCACGLYAHSTPEAIAGSVGAYAVGAVVIGYGNLIIHPDGWRAETAELVGIIDRSRVDDVDRNCPHAWSVNGARLSCYRCGASMQAVEMAGGLAGLDLLAEEYGVRVLDRWEDAEALARELGAEPVPEILHAEAEAWLLGPEKHEPLFPDNWGGHYGTGLERRVRELVPWLERGMIRGMDMNMGAAPMAYYVGGLQGQYVQPVSTEVRLSVIHPGLRAEVTITLHV